MATRCAICWESHPLQYHHMVEWAKLPHHDLRHMIAICGSCHTKCTKGTIDHKSQVIYKAKLLAPETNNDPHTAEKRNADKEVVTALTTHFPLSHFDWYFSRALSERVELIVDDYIAPVWKTFYSAMFTSTTKNSGSSTVRCSTATEQLKCSGRTSSTQKVRRPRS